MVASAVVMEHEAALQPWPAARRTGALIVAHPAWEDARNAILDLAAAGPVTVALVGPPGTGKTWLLRELASSLGDHGFPTMVLLQGDLPSVLAGGAALLIDEALRMSEPALETLLAQQHGVAVLTDLDRFGDIVAARQSPAAVIRLRPLEDTEMAEFVADWLRQSAVPPMVLDAAALAALIKNSRGAVRLAVQGLTAMVAARPVLAPIPLPIRGSIPSPIKTQPPPMELKVAPTVADTPIVEPVAPIQDEPIAATPIISPSRRTSRRVAAAITAIAACVALAWIVGARYSPTGPSTPMALAPTAPTSAATAPTETASAPPAPNGPALAGLPPLQPAEITAPMLAGGTAPSPEAVVAPDDVTPAAIQAGDPALAPDPAPALSRTVVVATAATPLPVAADQAPHPNLVATEVATPATALTPTTALTPATVATAANEPTPATVAIAAPPATAPVATPTSTVSAVATVASIGAAIAEVPVVRPPAPRGGVGIVLLAQRGDTLQSMYRDIYRGRAAPPYPDVLAANPRPIRPGAIVVFPAPPGGWATLQR